MYFGHILLKINIYMYYKMISTNATIIISLLVSFSSILELCNCFMLNSNINPIFQNWNCIGIKKHIDFSKPFITNIGELPLVTWRDKDNVLHTSINICKHMGSKFDKGTVNNGCLVCPYHGLVYDKKEEIGSTIEHEGKIFWSYMPKTHCPGRLPFFKNKDYMKSFIQIDMDSSFIDCAYNTMDILHPAHVHNGIFGFGNDNPPRNIQTFEYKKNEMFGLSFEYMSSGMVQKINMNTDSTQNFNMFESLLFTWSRATFNKNRNLFIGINLQPIKKNKTRWFITILHNYMTNNYIEEQFMKSMAITILMQDQQQMKELYTENILKQNIIFNHEFENEKSVKKILKIFENITYPDLNDCIELYKNYKNRDF